MVETNFLRGMFGRATPNESIFQAIFEITMDGSADSPNSSISTEDKRVVKVGSLAARLCIDAEEVEVLPTFGNKSVEIQIQIARHDNRVRKASQLIDTLQTNVVNFVVTIYRGDINTAAHNNIDELVDCTIFPDQYFSIVDFIYL